jgi:hypothetical protein
LLGDDSGNYADDVIIVNENINTIQKYIDLLEARKEAGL